MDNSIPSILVVENDPVQRDIISLALSQINCTISHSSNGKDAINNATRVNPNIILLDLFLPQMSGLEVLNHLKQNGFLTHTTIIVISAFGFPEIVQQAKEAGAFDFIIKPIDSAIVIQRVNKALARYA